MTAMGSTPHHVKEWPGMTLSLPSSSNTSASPGLGSGARPPGTLSRRAVAPPSLTVFTASFPSPNCSLTSSASTSASTSATNSAAATVSSFTPPTGGPSLAARRQHKRAPALGGNAASVGAFVPRMPAALDLNRVPTLEEEIARLPDLLSRLSLKRKAPPALGSMNMTLAGRKKARYMIVVDEEEETDDMSPKTSPLTAHHPPTSPVHFEILAPPARRRHGPKKRVRFADELESHHPAK